MPFKEITPTKLYYSITEVAEMFDVNASLLRYWEGEFDIIKPKKNKKGNRMFNKDDIEKFKLIFHLVKERGYTLQGAKLKLSESKAEVMNNLEVIEKLNKIKAFLLNLKKEL